MKEVMGSILAILFLLLIGIGYINNIIWMLDNWSVIEFSVKFLNVTGLFVPPLGGLIGIYHFF